MITSIIIHYNRAYNMPAVIAGIRAQTVPSEIWVWDNSGDCPPDGIDVLIKSSRNFLCQPRFTMADFVKTPYVWNQDDDVAIKDPTLFEKLVAESKKYPDSFFGWNGRQLTPDINWELAYQFPGKGWVGKTETDKVDMINVGISFYPTHLLTEIPRNPFKNTICQVTEEEYKYGDDMWISSFLKKRRVTSFMENGITLLGEKGQGLSKQTPHMIVRNELCRRYWKK